MRAKVPRMAKRVVVLGGGFAGAYCARGLESELEPGDEIVLLDRNNYFIFTPLLIEAGTGSLEPRHAVVPLRAFLRRAQFRMGRVTGWDRQRRRVRYLPFEGEDEVQLGYDHLVVALGSRTRLPDLPGLAEHAFQVKSIGDAVALRDRAIQLLERAVQTSDPERRRRLLHWVVVGGSYTGVEVAGEFDYFLRQACASYGLAAGEFRITLVEREARILPALDPALAEFARGHLENRGVRVLLESTLAEVDGQRIRLGGGEVLEASTLIWCAGIAPPRLVSELELPVDANGYIRTGRDLRVEGCGDVWAIGDCAANPDGKGGIYPATAQHAVQMGAVAAANIARVLEGRETKACEVLDKGTLAALGCRTGIARVFGVRLSGLPAWFLWRTVYLMKMPTWGRRLRVALDWTMDFFFRREYVQLGIHRGIASDRE